VGQHLAQSKQEIDVIVYGHLAAQGSVAYPKAYPKALFGGLGILYRFRHDVFCALKRLEEAGCITKAVEVTRPPTLGRTRYPAGRRVTYTAVKPPVVPAEQPDQAFAVS